LTGLPPSTGLPLAALLLADGRFPGGGHAHSGGLEAAVAAGAVRPGPPFPTLEAFLAGRLTTTGATDAWLAACACRGGDEVALDTEADARCPSPALRAASRKLGRGLRRAAGISFPAVVSGDGEHHAVVIGVVARAAGLTPADAAHLAVHHVLAGGVSAAVRLLPIDAADAMAVAMRLTPLAAAVAGAGAADDGRDGPPAWSAPLLEQRAEDHARWEVRLFAS
jgi:urease accessory protein